MIFDPSGDTVVIGASALVVDDGESILWHRYSVLHLSLGIWVIMVVFCLEFLHD